MLREVASVRVIGALLAGGMLLAGTGCSKLERLSIVRPTAERGDYTQVAPTYDVSDKGRKVAPIAAEQLLASATRSFQAGQLAQARDLAERAMKAKAPAGDAHTLLAMIASASGDTTEAGRHFTEALAVAPGNGSYANNYGTWLCDSGRAAESLAWFDKALADPAYATRTSALANGGSCAQKAGRVLVAESNWRQALALDPEMIPALAGMARLQYDKSNYLEARAFVERWLAIAPDDARALQLAAQIEQKLGDNAAAQRYLLRSQAIPPDPGTPVPPRTQ